MMSVTTTLTERLEVDDNLTGQRSDKHTQRFKDHLRFAYDLPAFRQIGQGSFSAKKIISSTATFRVLCSIVVMSFFKVVVWQHHSCGGCVCIESVPFIFLNVYSFYQFSLFQNSRRTRLVSVCTVADKAAPWAAYTKTGTPENPKKEPSGAQCKSCALTHARGYSSMSWAELLALCRTKPSFSESFLQTKRVVEKLIPPPQEHADDLVKMNMQCSRDFDFLSVSEVEAKADLRALVNVMDLPWVEVADERGVKVKGLLLHRPGPLRVTFSHAEEIVASRTLLGAGVAVRDGQAQEAGTQQMNRRYPTPSTIITPEALDELLESIRVSRAAAALQAAGTPQPPPLAMCPPTAPAAEEDDVELDPDLQRALDENKS
eukprot:2577607-Amphidinium_carterae.1